MRIKVLKCERYQFFEVSGGSATITDFPSSSTK